MCAAQGCSGFSETVSTRTHGEVGGTLPGPRGLTQCDPEHHLRGPGRWAPQCQEHQGAAAVPRLPGLLVRVLCLVSGISETFYKETLGLTTPRNILRWKCPGQHILHFPSDSCLLRLPVWAWRGGPAASRPFCHCPLVAAARNSTALSAAVGLFPSGLPPHLLSLSHVLARSAQGLCCDVSLIQALCGPERYSRQL